jgi:hypothetical protein
MGVPSKWDVIHIRHMNMQMIPVKHININRHYPTPAPTISLALSKNQAPRNRLNIIIETLDQNIPQCNTHFLQE